MGIPVCRSREAWTAHIFRSELNFGLQLKAEKLLCLGLILTFRYEKSTPFPAFKSLCVTSGFTAFANKLSVLSQRTTEKGLQWIIHSGFRLHLPSRTGSSGYGSIFEAEDFRIFQKDCERGLEVREKGKKVARSARVEIFNSSFRFPQFYSLFLEIKRLYLFNLKGSWTREPVSHLLKKTKECHPTRPLINLAFCLIFPIPKCAGCIRYLRSFFWKIISSYSLSSFSESKWARAPVCVHACVCDLVAFEQFLASCSLTVAMTIALSACLLFDSLEPCAGYPWCFSVTHPTAPRRRCCCKRLKLKALAVL